MRLREPVVRPLTMLVAAFLISSVAIAQIPAGTAFTYQGRLSDGSVPANGAYDLELSLYDAATDGSQVGSTILEQDVVVADGLFVVTLDFGSGAFTGSARWLQIGVRLGASPGAFMPLASRQELTPTPNAIQVPWSGVSSKPAGFADNVDNDSGGDITGVAAGSGLTGGGTTGDVTLSLDTGATDARYVLKSGDTMTGTLTLNPSAGVALSTSADVDLRGRVMRGSAPFIQANTSGNTSIGENALLSYATGAANTATGRSALNANTSGFDNTATGMNTLSANTTGYQNTATGVAALQFNTAGNYNTAMGAYALLANTTGSNNTATGVGALQSNTAGISNTSIGHFALYSNTAGRFNTATGQAALSANTTGNNNTATGRSALSTNTTGNYNTAMGYAVLQRNTIGEENTAAGFYALNANTTGYANNAVGSGALVNNTTGSRNIAVGFGAGSNATTGNDNIYIGNSGVAAESGTIRIGTSENHTRLFAAGVSGVSVIGSPVFVDGNGQLGINTSSREFKDDIRDIDDASAGLLRLRPVSFRYKEPEPSGQHPLQYGLIAEEVAEVYPELVTYSDSGQPRSVQYHLLISMLLNELQKQHRRLQAQDEQLRMQSKEIHELRTLQDKIGELTARLAQIENR